jgi:hypothetical protein
MAFVLLPTRGEGKTALLSLVLQVYVRSEALAVPVWETDRLPRRDPLAAVPPAGLILTLPIVPIEFVKKILEPSLTDAPALTDETVRSTGTVSGTAPGVSVTVTVAVPSPLSTRIELTELELQS